jgi:RNA polymerase sigma-70 factor (ECF subfamily)
VICATAVLTALRDRARPGTDDALLERHLAGDPAAFEQIYRAHVAAVYRRISRLLGPVPEREDLTQDVFLALHRALPGFRGEAQLTTLLHRIAINRACEYLRKQTRRRTTLMDGWVFDELESAELGPDGVFASQQVRRTVLACLAKIKPKKRVALLLRIVEGLTFEEIGRLVDATPETVAKRVQHGHRELDELLVRAERDAQRGTS